MLYIDQTIKQLPKQLASITGVKGGHVDTETIC